MEHRGPIVLGLIALAVACMGTSISNDGTQITITDKEKNPILVALCDGLCGKCPVMFSEDTSSLRAIWPLYVQSSGGIVTSNPTIWTRTTHTLRGFVNITTHVSPHKWRFRRDQKRDPGFVVTATGGAVCVHVRVCTYNMDGVVLTRDTVATLVIKSIPHSNTRGSFTDVRVYVMGDEEFASATELRLETTTTVLSPTATNNCITYFQMLTPPIGASYTIGSILPIPTTLTHDMSDGCWQRWNMTLVQVVKARKLAKPPPLEFDARVVANAHGVTFGLHIARTWNQHAVNVGAVFVAKGMPTKYSEQAYPEIWTRSTGVVPPELVTNNVPGYVRDAGVTKSITITTGDTVCLSDPTDASNVITEMYIQRCTAWYVNGACSAHTMVPAVVNAAVTDDFWFTAHGRYVVDANDTSKLCYTASPRTQGTMWVGMGNATASQCTSDIVVDVRVGARSHLHYGVAHVKSATRLRSLTDASAPLYVRVICAPGAYYSAADDSCKVSADSIMQAFSLGAGVAVALVVFGVVMTLDSH